MLSAEVTCVSYKGALSGVSSSAMKIDKQNIVYSTANKTDRGTEIRLYNPSCDIVSDSIIFDKSIKSAYITDFEGSVLSSCQYSKNQIMLNLQPYEIATVLIEFSQD